MTEEQMNGPKPKASGRLGEVVALAKAGVNADQIGTKLGLMKNTVKTYLHTARVKGFLPRPTGKRGSRMGKVAAFPAKATQSRDVVGLEIGPRRDDGRVTILVHAPTKTVGAIIEHLTTRYVG